MTLLIKQTKKNWNVFIIWYIELVRYVKPKVNNVEANKSHKAVNKKIKFVGTGGLASVSSSSFCCSSSNLSLFSEEFFFFFDYIYINR